MQTRLFSLVVGIVYLLIGILSFIPGLRTTPPAGAPTVDATAAYGYFLGHFPANAVTDVFYVLVGLIGIIAFARLDFSRLYLRTVFLIFGFLACIGFIPNGDTILGLAPIFGSDTWLHAVTSVLAGYFGFVAPEPTYVEPAPGHVAHA